MEYQDLNLKRQIFSKDKLRGELVVKKSDAFYLTGTSSGSVIRGINYTDHLGDEYVFWVNNSRQCRRAKLTTKGVIINNASITGIINSVTLTQVVSGTTYLPGQILPAFSIGKIYFLYGGSGFMEFDYDFTTHSFTYIGNISLGATVATGFSYIDNGNTLAIYYNASTIGYYPLSTPYNLSTFGAGSVISTTIRCAANPYFFNEGKNAYYYQFMGGSGQFDFCVARLTTPYRIETAVKRYGVAFNRTTWNADFSPSALPFTLNENRSIISMPAGPNGTMSHGVFTINGKFNKNLNVTIIP